MGDIKRLKKKYQPSRHPWNRQDIEQGKQLRKDYGLKGRKEILIAGSFLKMYKDRAKKLIASQGMQAAKERKDMLDKLQRMGLLMSGAQLDDVLSIQLQDVLNRRLQSIVSRKGLARSMNQARQFIVHRHVSIHGKEITSPSYLVSLAEETAIGFKPTSSLAAEDHPERVPIPKETKKMEGVANENEQKPDGDLIVPDQDAA